MPFGVNRSFCRLLAAAAAKHIETSSEKRLGCVLAAATKNNKCEGRVDVLSVDGEKYDEGEGGRGCLGLMQFQFQSQQQIPSASVSVDNKRATC